MKILFCNERFLFRFGVDRVLLLLGEGLKQRGHTIYVMANHIDIKPVEAFANKIIEVPRGKDSYFNLNEFAAQWLEENINKYFDSSSMPDLVIIGGWPFFKCIPVFRSMGIKVIFMDCGAVPLCGMDDGQKNIQEKLRSMRNEYLKYSHQLIAISNFIETTQSRKDKGTETLVSTILLGADHLEHQLWSSEKVDYATDISHCIQEYKQNEWQLILNLGRWENNNYKNSKAIYDLLRLLLKINSKKIAILVLSDGADMNTPSDLQEHIIPIGYPSDDALHDLMTQVDAGVSVSLWEGFNLPLAEMQWVGKPVVVFDIGAHPEVVAHPWFLAEDVSQMAVKLNACLNHSGLSEAEHRKALKIFRKNFRWELVVERYEKALFNIIPSRIESAPSGIQILIDVTNSAHDPANSGVIRVTRSLCKALQGFCNPIFVLWDNSINAYVFPTDAEYCQLGAFNGPDFCEYHIQSPPGNRQRLDAHLVAKKFEQRWLLLTETVIETNGRHIREFSRRHGIHLAAVFYDSIPILHPELCLDTNICINHADYMRGLAQCDIIFPISDFSGKCLLEYWQKANIQPSKVVPILLPGEFRAGPRLSRPSLFNSNRIEILCVSTLEPRKNHVTLLQSLKLLSKLHADIDWTLTLVGNRYAGGDDIAEMVETVCAEDLRVRWIGVADDATLRRLYESCSFTVYPSFIEGYGMPIIESLWHAKPCICHNQGVMAELAVGGGCLTVNILDVEELATAIFRLSTDRVLHDNLSKQAVMRPIKSWSEYAKEMFTHMLELFPMRQPINSNTESTKPLPPSQNISLKSTTSKSLPDILYPSCLTENWQMNDSERLALTALLHRLKPKCSIEIGTFKGGSLSLISQYSEMIFSIDIDPSVPANFRLFKNVSFLTGPSQVILPLLFAELDRQGIPVEFILIDGDHSAAGVKRDMNLVFGYEPKSPLFVMMHDSFNPGCRRGMKEANWKSARYLRWADLDFIPGRLVEHGGGGHGELWGGLGMMYFEPGDNEGKSIILDSAKEMQAWVSNIQLTHE